MEEFAWLFKLLPEGVSVTAVLACVTVFLKYLFKIIETHRSTVESLTAQYTEQLDKHSEAFREEMSETRATFNAQLKEITDSFNDQHKDVRDHIETVSKETVLAIKSLEGAIRNLEGKVNR